VALGFGRARSSDVVSLIAAKKYGPAIEILRVQLKKRGASTTVRKQLADVLVLSGKTVEAVALLLPLADKFAREGFAAKAVSVLKKIQKIDPGRRDVEERLARLIEEKQREASIALPISQPGAEIGMEEIGIDAPPSGSIGLMVEPPANLPTEDGPALEIGFGSAPISTPTPTPSPEPAVSPEPGLDAPQPAPEEPKTAEPVAAPPTDAPALDFGSTASRALEDSSPDATLPLPDPPPPPDLSEEGVLDLGAKPIEDETSASGEIEDYDLLYEPEGEEAEEEAAAKEEEEVVAPAASADDLMSEAGFADELMSLVDSVFDAPAEAPGEASAGTATAAGPQRAGGQIVVSPLFRDFSVDEMVAVIQGLKLLTFDRGEVILQEGKPGASLYTLTSGRVRAFRKDQQTGKQVQIGDLKEGAFRAASIVALNSCELLELDRAALDGITSSHPHVWDVLREFAEKRSQARG